jgi:hypothetical protein
VVGIALAIGVQDGRGQGATVVARPSPRTVTAGSTSVR